MWVNSIYDIYFIYLFMRKLIDIPDSLIKELRFEAAKSDKSFKKFIEDVITDSLVNEDPFDNIERSKQFKVNNASFGLTLSLDMAKLISVSNADGDGDVCITINDTLNESEVLLWVNRDEVNGLSEIINKALSREIV